MADLSDLLALQRDRWSAILCDTELAASRTCSEPNRHALLEAADTMRRAYERTWAQIDWKFGADAVVRGRALVEGAPVQPKAAQREPEQAGLFA